MKQGLTELKVSEQKAMATASRVANETNDPPTQADFIKITCAQLQSLSAQVAVLKEEVRELNARTIRQVRLGG